MMEIDMSSDPVIEAYKKDVDDTLLRENLKLTPEQRICKAQAALHLVEEVRRAGAAARLAASNRRNARVDGTLAGHAS